MADEGLGVRMAQSNLLPATAEDAAEETCGTLTTTDSGLATCFSGCGEQSLVGDMGSPPFMGIPSTQPRDRL